MYENLPAVFEYARLVKGSSERVKLTYDEYLRYKEEYENNICSNHHPKNWEKGTIDVVVATTTNR